MLSLRPSASPSPLRSREALLIVGLVSALAIWYVWAAIDPLPLVEDEYSYVLQSRIFATGRWTAPSPPAPDFFQQPHVLTAPAVASKYAPGHALLMTAGSLLGAPVLVPLLLTGLTGVMLFALAKRVANVWVAALAWVLWLGDPLNLRFRAAYYSEVTTSAMWFLSWWALLEWRNQRQRRWLLLLAAAIGWGAITRPLTMLAFAIPVGVIVLRDVAQHKLWKDFALSVSLGTAILGIIPLWSARTTGDWRLTPQTLYTRDYLPYDKLGFGVDTTPPARQLSPANRFTYEGFFKQHVEHTPANLPRIALDRLRVIAREQWGGPRMILVPFVLLGLFVMNAQVAFALVCSIALFVGYLSYGHWSQWTLYYFEAMPVLSMLAALGIWRTIEWPRSRTSVNGAATSATAARPVIIALLPLVALTGYELQHARLNRQSAAAEDIALRQLIDTRPMRAAVVFIHPAPRLGPHSAFVANSPNLADEPLWIVHDLGPRNAELMRVAGSRTPLALYEDGGKIEIDRSLINAPAGK